MTEVSPSLRRWITLALLGANFMLSLDVTVVSVSLPHLQGSLSASPEQITWVVTSYIVAQVMVTPVVGWLAARLGVKTMLLACTALFTLTSLLCGLATTFPEMVAYRALQGATGAPLAPLAQATLMTIYPPDKIGRAMALNAMAAVASPCFGPVLGAWLTDQYSWRWCFFVNLPVCGLSMLLLWIFLPRDAPAPRRFDFLGFFSLAIAVACLQLMLDRGPSKDWFGSGEIIAMATLAAVFFWVYLAHTLTTKTPLFNITIFRNRNFVTACILTVFFSVQMFSIMALLPQMTQGIMGYPVLLSGLVVLPRGLIMLLVLQVIGHLDATVDRRLLMGIGIAIMTLSCFQMVRFDLTMTPDKVMVATMLQGLGQAIVMVPVVSLGFSTLKAEARADAAAIANLIRYLGGSAGIAIMQGVIVFNQQRMHASLTEHITPGDPVVSAGVLGNLSQITEEAAVMLNAEITRQAAMVAYVDVYLLISVMTVSLAPLLLLLRSPRANRSA